MVKKKKSYGSRLRSRGGLSVRKQWSRIRMQSKKIHKCPSCFNKTVKRESVGIWLCTKCGHRFSGGAYTPSTKLGHASMRTR